MAQLCHDQYDHPLLWCESKRRAEEKRIADESWTLVQKRKEFNEAKKIRECNEVSQTNHMNYERSKQLTNSIIIFIHFH